MPTKRCVFLLSLLFALCCANPQLRGVAPAFRNLYEAPTLSCSNIHIPISKVNDEFCDCELDGLDEPGTSACQNGKFFCQNSGYRGQYIFSSNVNDGICDCCDGSDEYSGAITCANNCVALGEQFKAQYLRDMEIMQQGITQRKIHRQQAITSLSEVGAKVAAIKDEELAQAAKVAELEGPTAEAERLEREEREALEVANAAANNATTNATTADATAATTVDAAAATARTSDSPPADAVQTPAETSSTDTAAATAFPYPKEYAFPSEQQTAQQTAQQTEDQTAADQTAHDAAEHTAFPYPNEYAFHEAAADAADTDVEAEATTETTAEAVPAAEASPKSPMQVIAEALRSDLNAAKAALTEIESRRKEQEAILAIDFGPGQVFAAYHKQCIDLAVRQYTYEICFFGSAAQKEGSSSTSLGTWSWEGDKYRTMKFTNGQTCWNGPARSMEVTFRCGAVNALLSIDEPARCVYTATATTPAVCDEAELQAAKSELDQQLRKVLVPRGHQWDEL